MADYKYKIDKEALKRFFLDDVPSKESLKSVKMLITAVIIKHYIKYISIEEDLRSLCIMKLLESKSVYDLSYSAYNFAYTKCRNEIGNYINKQKEVIVEDILPIYNASIDPDVVSLPSEVNKFKKLLTGEEQFKVIELSPKDAINLILFCDLHSSSRKLEPPEFLKNNPRALYLLYKLLLKI